MHSGWLWIGEFWLPSWDRAMESEAVAVKGQEVEERENQVLTTALRKEYD